MTISSSSAPVLEAYVLTQWNLIVLHVMEFFHSYDTPD